VNDCGSFVRACGCEGGGGYDNVCKCVSARVHSISNANLYKVAAVYIMSHALVVKHVVVMLFAHMQHSE
jgi:hypothetical protein